MKAVVFFGITAIGILGAVISGLPVVGGIVGFGILFTGVVLLAPSHYPAGARREIPGPRVRDALPDAPPLPVLAGRVVRSLPAGTRSVDG